MGTVEVADFTEQGILWVINIVDSAIKLALLFSDQFIPVIDVLLFITDDVTTTFAEFPLTILRFSTNVVAFINCWFDSSITPPGYAA